jgi:enoyl-CoA hydratase/carnithine racemase
METEALVVVEQRGTVRRLTLNRPEQMNALSGEPRPQVRTPEYASCT